MELLGKPLHTNMDNCKKNNFIKNMKLVCKEAKESKGKFSVHMKVYTFNLHSQCLNWNHMRTICVLWVTYRICK